MDHALLRANFTLVLDREPLLVRKFYDTLFARNPEMRALFPSRGHQEKMLARALVAMVDRIEDKRWIEEQLLALGRRHAQYRIRPEMYVPFGEALIATIAAISGTDWTPALDAAWHEAFAEIARLMVQGASEAAA